jgi:hypothetical protein
MRRYMGAGVIAPENIIILNDVQCLGIVSGHGTKKPKSIPEDPSRTSGALGMSMYKVPELSGGDYQYMPYDEDNDDETDLVLCMKMKSTPYSDLFKDYMFLASCKMNGIHHGLIGYTKTFAPLGGPSPMLPYAGAVFSNDAAHTVM